MVAFFQKSGEIQSFASLIDKRNLQRRGASAMAYLLVM